MDNLMDELFHRFGYALRESYRLDEIARNWDLPPSVREQARRQSERLLEVAADTNAAINSQAEAGIPRV